MALSQLELEQITRILGKNIGRRTLIVPADAPGKRSDGRSDSLTCISYRLLKRARPPTRTSDTVSFSESGKSHFERREIPEALDCFLKALKTGEDPETTAFERWASWMFLGEFERAWEESDQAGSSFRGRRPIKGGRFLIRCLRGLGDAIQFLRYARQLRQHCDHVTVHAPARLLPLCKLIPGIDEAISFDRALHGTGYDYEIECSDLPYLFRTTLAGIPYPDGYLPIPVERANCGRAAVSDDRGRLQVGLVWAAASWNPIRSIPLDLFEPLTQISALALLSLQRGPESDQLRTFLPGTIRNAESDAGDIVDTMVVISRLALVITVDTMVAHLAGAMGKPVWTLLNHEADWRWMLNKSDSPWYRSMRLFRQPYAGDWKSVIAEVRDSIQQHRK